jgi:DNA-binding response OmpR family regulator
MKTIVIVEDTADLLMNLTDFLRMEGYRVIGFASGGSALDHLRIETPDILITDLSMPDMDGFELIRAVRQDLKLDDLPIAIFSARPKEENLLKAKSFGVSLYITKPCEPEKLVGYIESIINPLLNEEN